MAEYEGLFLRHYLHQRPGGPQEGWTDSPDIILNSTSPAREPNIFTTQQNYEEEPADVARMEEDNWIYVRGLNTARRAIAPRLWLFYVRSNLVLWPTRWRYDNIWTKNPRRPENWLNLAPVEPGKIGLSNPTFIWRPPELTAQEIAEGRHYCMIAYAENPPLNQEEPPESPFERLGSLGSWEELAAFVQSRPNMAWRNTTDVSGEGTGWQKTVPVGAPREGGQFSIGVRCKNMPTDGFFRFSVEGYNEETSIIYPEPVKRGETAWAPIHNRNESALVSVTWREGFESSITVSWRGPTQPERGANVTPVIGIESSRLEGWIEHPFRSSVRLPILQSRRLGADSVIESVHIMGSQPYTWLT